MVLLSSACLDSGNGGCSCRPDLHQLPLRQLFRFERIEALTPMSFTHRWQIELFSLSRCPIQASRGLCGPRLTREGSLLAAPQSSAVCCFSSGDLCPLSRAAGAGRVWLRHCRRAPTASLRTFVSSGPCRRLPTCDHNLCHNAYLSIDAVHEAPCSQQLHCLRSSMAPRSAAFSSRLSMLTMLRGPQSS